MSRKILTKAEKREQLNLKRKRAPQGATLADELKQIKSVGGYKKTKAKKINVRFN